MIINLEENTRLAFDQIVENIELFTYPIFQENQKGIPELVASSVAIELAGKHFLCSAAHTLNGLDNKLRTYSTNSDLKKKGIFIGLDDKVIYTKDKNGADFDLCLFDVRAIKNNFNFLHESQITKGSDFSIGSLQILLGYPLSKNKPYKAINKASNEIRTAIQPIRVKLDSNINFAKFNKKKENVHIAFKYKVDDKKMLLPKLVGMSGGGVWNIPTILNPNKFYLAGIFLEHHRNEKICFATKAKYIRKLSNQYIWFGHSLNNEDDATH